MKIQLIAEHLHSPDLNLTAFPASLLSLTEKCICTAQHGGPPAAKL